uniref:Uncharacterized protein n=1 Tax=Anguilla anguilla TaxID=7936 RepID=A0A0E9W8L5_ANGAN
MGRRSLISKRIGTTFGSHVWTRVMLTIPARTQNQRAGTPCK